MDGADAACIAPLIADIQRTTDVPVRVELGEVREVPASGKRRRLAGETYRFAEATLHLGRGHRPIEVPQDPGHCAAFLDATAERVQDSIIEDLHGAWPTCPLGHNHPLVTRFDDSQAWWACPSSDWRTRIGTLPPRADR